MRAELLRAFDSIHLLDLHGSSRRRERGPEGLAEENVFDIQQGVAIALLVKRPTAGKKRTLHAERWGGRASKYAWLEENRSESTEWSELPTRPPSHLFIPLRGNESEYRALVSLSTVFEVVKSGLNTDRDRLCIDFEAQALASRMRRLFEGDIDDAFRQRYDVRASSSYDPEAAAKRAKYDPQAVRVCLYRPFDLRAIYYQVGFTSRPVVEAQGNMLQPNIGLLLARQTKEAFGAFVTRHLSTHKIVAVYDRTSLAPLFIYGRSDAPTLDALERRPNLAADFVSKLQEQLGLPLKPRHMAT